MATGFLAALEAGAQTNGCPLDSFYSGLASNRVVFTSSCTLTFTNTIAISTNLVIDAGSNQVILAGSGAARLFTIETNGTLALRGVTITGGREGTLGGGGFWVKFGGKLFLTNCVVGGNIVTGADGDDGVDGEDHSLQGDNGTAGTAGEPSSGGAIYNQGEIVAINSSFYTNRATGGSGGIGGIGGNGAWTGGNAGAGGNGGTAYGGAVYNLGSFTASNCLFSANAATAGSGGDGNTGGDGDTRGNGGRGGTGRGALGGAIYSQGALDLTDCTFTGQTVSGGDGGAGGATGVGYFGGLIGNGGAAEACSGGAIHNLGSMSLKRCTISANVVTGGDSADGGSQPNYNGTDGPSGAAASGGGIYTAGPQVAVTNCTFHGNQVFGGAGGNGGGSDGTPGDGGNGGNGVGASLCNAGSISVVNSTFFGGKALGGTNGLAGSGTFAGTDGTVGQALGGNLRNQGAVFNVANTIVAYPTNALNGSGTFTDLGHNLSTDTTVAVGSSSRKSTNPVLGALADNGGRTMTMLLLAGSPALNGATNSLAPQADQRGSVRPGLGNTNADIGAVEIQGITITAEPEDIYATAGSSSTFRVTATGDAPLKYQWRFYGTNLPSATNAQLTLAQAQATNAGPYYVVITNSIGSVTSRVATLSLGVSPSITSHPASQLGVVGGSVSFAAAASGTAPLYYQWRFQGANLAGETSTDLVLTNLAPTNTGNYTVVVSNLFGSALSGVATLRVASNMSLGTPTVTSSNFAFTYPGQPGLFYLVQYKDTLTATNWSNLKTSVTPIAGLITNLDSWSGARTSRFYRVVTY